MFSLSSLIPNMVQVSTLNQLLNSLYIRTFQYPGVLSLMLILLSGQLLANPGSLDNFNRFPDLIPGLPNPVITVRLASPDFNCNTDEYCMNVQFQSNTANQELFGMNVRFFYDDVTMEIINFRGFVGGYGPIAPNPPTNSYSASAGPSLFSFGGGSDYINGAIQLTNENAPPVYISTTGWTTLFQLCYTINDPNVDINFFCPSVVLDLEYDPANGGFLPGSDGIVMTVVNPAGGTIPVTENVNQFNWAYDGPGPAPYGAPQSLTCSSINCLPTLNSPPNITIACTASTLPSNTGQATATDQCNGDPVVTYSDAIGTGTCPAGYLIIRTWQASDNCGNTSSAQQTISLGNATCNLLVNSTADSGAGSLRAAIECADPGDTITFSSSLAGMTINITSARLVIPKNLYIRSNVSPRIKINSQIVGLFEIALGKTVEFKDLDITSGLAVPNNGGAAFNNMGNLKLVGVKVFKNASLPSGQALVRNRPTSLFTLVGNCFIEIP